MISIQENFPKLTLEEYFTWQEQQVDKYEYIDGEIHPIQTKSVNHCRISIRLTSLLFDHLENSHFDVGGSDMRIKIVDANSYVHADGVVTGDERDKQSTQFITYPCLIFDVSPKSTETCDRGEKFRWHQKNPVLQNYLLVDSTGIEMDLYHKNDAGEWLIKNYQTGDIIKLQSINLSFPIEQVYQGLDLTEE